MRRLWLIFAQACTVCLALLFVISTLRPEWLSRAVPAAKEVVLLQADSARDLVKTNGGAPRATSI